jgi:hypothetical protein
VRTSDDLRRASKRRVIGAPRQPILQRCCLPRAPRIDGSNRSRRDGGVPERPPRMRDAAGRACDERPGWGPREWRARVWRRLRVAGEFGSPSPSGQHPTRSPSRHRYPSWSRCWASNPRPADRDRSHPANLVSSRTSSDKPLRIPQPPSVHPMATGCRAADHRTCRRPAPSVQDDVWDRVTDAWAPFHGEDGHVRLPCFATTEVVAGVQGRQWTLPGPFKSGRCRT